MLPQTRPALSVAQKWFDAGIEKTESFKRNWQKAREDAMNAGFFFAKARDNCPSGEWLFLLESNAAKIKPRTVRFFIQISEAALAWVRELLPETPATKLQAVAAKEVMMLSPKPLVALLRELRELRPFGEYDAVKYAQRKLNGVQIEFNFDHVFSTLALLDHLGDCQFVLPEGKQQTEALAELAAKLEAATAKVKAQLLESKTIDL